MATNIRIFNDFPCVECAWVHNALLYCAVSAFFYLFISFFFLLYRATVERKSKKKKKRRREDNAEASYKI